MVTDYTSQIALPLAVQRLHQFMQSGVDVSSKHHNTPHACESIWTLDALR